MNAIFDEFTNTFSKVSIDKNTFVLHFNDGASGYNKLSDFITKDYCLILPYQMSDIGENLAISNTQFTAAFDGFKQALIKLYKLEDESEKKPVDFNKMRSDNVSKENKLSMYLTLKSIYDKHYYKLNDKENLELYDINAKNGEFDRFHFIDSFYTDIGDKLLMNCEKLSNLIAMVIDYEEDGSGHGVVSSEMNLYTFMSEICRINNMMLIAMPIFNGSFTDKEGIENFETMFTPIPYNDCVGRNTLKGPSYVCIYPHQPSHHLNLPNSQYANDGIDITTSSDPYISGDDIASTSDFSGPTSIRDLFTESGDYIIPAFGVEYGIQNQGIFKSINVNMDSPQTTEYAVASMFNIANMKSQETPRKQTFIGQDIYKIYSNHSYTCTVEMMGCAQIQPLMYFELTNIPLFRGAYMIIKVEHNITPGNMTTTFTGVRISKNKIPMVNNIINLNDILDTVSNDVHSEVDMKISKDAAARFNGALQSDLSGEDRYIDIPNNDYTYTDILNLNNNGDVVKFEAISSNPNNAKGAFNESNPELRKLVYGIAKRAGETIGGITITSMTRTTDPTYTNKSSDHCVGNNVSQRRKELSGKDYLGETKLYSEMGCAVDLLGNNKKGIKDKQESSIALFDLIALEFTNNIRQLIWEVQSGACATNNYISNCIHLSSYGHGPKCNDRTEIFVALGDSFKSIEADNLKDLSKAPTNLPPMFIKTLYRLALSGKDLKEITFNNFKGKKLTTDLLKKWCEELGV